MFIKNVGRHNILSGQFSNMVSRPATYATVMPDDNGNDRIPRYAPKPPVPVHRNRIIDAPHEYSDLSNESPSDPKNQSGGRASDASGGRISDASSGRISDASSGSQSPPELGSMKSATSGDEREILKRQITKNNIIFFGLLFVIAILTIGLWYTITHYSKSNLDPPVRAGPPVISGTDPPDASLVRPIGTMGQYTPVQVNLQTEDKHAETSSNARAAAQNDKLLRQRQRRTPAQNKQSAMARHRHGHSDQDDRQRLETIVEGSESQVDDVNARTREYISRQLQEDARLDARDEPLGTGSYDTTGDEDLESVEPTSVYTGVEEVRDEALDLPGDADDEGDEESNQPPPAKVAVLCPAILAHGQRSGQECSRECSPGKAFCKSHLAVNARKK